MTRPESCKPYTRTIHHRRTHLDLLAGPPGPPAALRLLSPAFAFAFAFFFDGSNLSLSLIVTFAGPKKLSRGLCFVLFFCCFQAFDVAVDALLSELVVFHKEFRQAIDVRLFEGEFFTRLSVD